jgi:putative tricarboxylic transport membrane protein
MRKKISLDRILKKCKVRYHTKTIRKEGIMSSKRTMLLAVVAVSFFFVVASVVSTFAQEKPKDYPKRTVQVVVGYGPGGGSDIFSRTVCIPARRYMRNPLVVMNKPGAGGVLAMEYVQSQPADGYTLLSGSIVACVTAGLQGLTKYQYTDFQPILRAQYDTMMMEVLPGGKYNNVQDVIADAKARPGKQTWGVVGSATGFNALLARQFTEPMGMDVKLVPFDRAGKQHAALLGRHLDVILEEPGPISELLKAGKMKPVLVFAEERIEDFADVPTVKELGPEAYLGVWRGIVVKKGTPKPIVDYLHAIFKKSVDSGFYKKYERSEYLHLRPGYLNPEDFFAFMQKEAEFYTREYKRIGIYKIKK